MGVAEDDRGHPQMLVAAAFDDRIPGRVQQGREENGGEYD